VAVAMRASKVFLLWLPFERPRFRDAGGDIFGALSSFLPSVGTLSPPMVEPLREDMAELGSERRESRRGEKWGCTLGHGRAQYLKGSGEGENPRRFTNQPHIVCSYCSCRSRSWEEPMGRVANMCQSAPHDDSGSYDGGDSEVKMIRLATGALRRPRRGIKTRSGMSPKGAVYRLTTTKQAPAGLDLGPAHLETVGGVPRDLALKPATSRPDKESWDFNGNEQDFGEEKNPLKPYANP
jgi:hypothetical protein